MHEFLLGSRIKKNYYPLFPVDVFFVLFCVCFKPSFLLNGYNYGMLKDLCLLLS